MEQLEGFVAVELTQVADIDEQLGDVGASLLHRFLLFAEWH